MKAGIDLRNASRCLVLFILLASAASLIRPAYAQTIVIAPASMTTTASMGSIVTQTLTLTTPDVGGHTVSLSIVYTGGGWWTSPGSFSANPVTVPNPGSATSILTIAIPGPDYLCPGTSNAGAYILPLTIQATDTTTLAVIGSSSIVVNLLPIAFPLTVSVEPSKTSYMVGDNVKLTLNSNAPAEYYLKIRKPDGTTWGSAHGYLPATYEKKAAEPIGTYTAELTAYYCGTAQASASFSVTPDTYEITISINGLPPDATTALLVDGNKLVDMKGGAVKVMPFPIGTSHTLQVDQYVSGTPGYRYFCASNTWTANAEGSNVFNYVAQYYLDVSTEPAGITDVTVSGWYAVGYSISIASVPNEVQGTQGTKYAFTTWTVDGTPRAGNGFVVTMDTPHKVVAKYDTMFLLTIVSDYGNPKGAGYYKSGDTATFSVDSPVGIGIQRVFVEWTGDYTGNDPKGSTTMDGPKTATATWTTNYFQLYIIIGAIAAIAVVAGVLLWMRRRRGPATVKPPPPPPPPPPSAEVTETPSEPPTPVPAIASESKPAVLIAIRCTNCGHELKEGLVYCPECGQKQID
jgi:hypothetical protein